ncbi:MAG: tyrosine-type recombinase/integrase [Thermoguttaceae bacterium]
MASIWKDARNGNYLIKFHYGGQRYTRSCQTDKETAAHRTKTRVEETIGLLNTGRLQVPAGAKDVGIWIMSGGRTTEKPNVIVPALKELGEICDAYYENQRDKATTTLTGGRVHIGHLKRLLREHRPLSQLQLADIEKYVSARAAEKTRDDTLVSGKTIRKELTTFMQIWDWARPHGYVNGPCPVKDPNRPRKWAVKIAKDVEPEAFMTWDEIERRIARMAPENVVAPELWKRLSLDEKQRDELLAHVLEKATHPFIYPMFQFTAYTGARRSEVCRSQIEDFHFDEGIVVIRERKRRKDRAATTRRIPLHAELRKVMEVWFKQHPGGPYTIAVSLAMARRKTKEGFEELSREEAHHHFKKTLADSKWKVITGFHVLRHSFGAICTRKGVPMNVIAAWMGHTTQEMMALYQHLHPEDQQDWMRRL